MIDLKDACSIDLTFPYHGDTVPVDYLAELQSYFEKSARTGERFLTGGIIDQLEHDIADLLGKDAALWCPTGTMAQGIALRLYAQQRDCTQFLAHPTSHILLHEEEAYAEVHGLQAEMIGSWHDYYCAEDLHNDAACAVLELPQRHNGGQLPTWDHLSTLKERATFLGLPFHLDGARIWSCRPHYENRSYSEIADGFSSVYVSLYKDIGALGGAVLAGEASFIEAARRVRTQMGGLLAAHWPLVADAARLLQLRLAHMDDYVLAARSLAASLGKESKEMLDPATPHTNMFHLKLPVGAHIVLELRDKIARDHGVWLTNRFWEILDEEGCRLEIVVGEKLLSADKEKVATALNALGSSLATS